MKDKFKIAVTYHRQCTTIIDVPKGLASTRKKALEVSKSLMMMSLNYNKLEDETTHYITETEIIEGE